MVENMAFWRWLCCRTLPFHWCLPLWDWCGLVFSSVLETSSWVSPAPLGSAFDVLQICDNCWKDCEGNVCATPMHVLNLRTTNMCTIDFLWNSLFWWHLMWCFYSGKRKLFDLYIFVCVFSHTLQSYFFPPFFIWWAVKTLLLNERVQSDSWGICRNTVITLQ